MLQGYIVFLLMISSKNNFEKKNHISLKESKHLTGSNESAIRSLLEIISGFSLIAGCLPSIASQ